MTLHILCFPDISVLGCFSLTPRPDSDESAARECPCVLARLLTTTAFDAGTIAHVVVMPNIGIDKLETFVAELIQSRSRVAVAAARSLAASARAANIDD